MSAQFLDLAGQGLVLGALGLKLGLRLLQLPLQLGDLALVIPAVAGDQSERQRDRKHQGQVSHRHVSSSLWWCSGRYRRRSARLAGFRCHRDPG
jgi:hypothetical protein